MLPSDRLLLSQKLEGFEQRQATRAAARRVAARKLRLYRAQCELSNEMGLPKYSPIAQRLRAERGR